MTAQRAFPGMRRTGTTTPRAASASSRGLSAPGRCWSAGASSGAVGSRVTPARRAPPPEGAGRNRAARLEHADGDVVRRPYGSG